MRIEESRSYLSVEDRFPKIRNENLNALEECFFVGGSALIGEEVVNTGVIKKGRTPDYLKPRKLFQGSSVEAVNRERSKGYIRGLLPFFDYEGLRTLSEKGLEVALRTPPADLHGLAPTEWDVVVVPSSFSGENLEDELIQALTSQNIGNLAIREDDRAIFELENRGENLVLKMI